MALDDEEHVPVRGQRPGTDGLNPAETTPPTEDQEDALALVRTLGPALLAGVLGWVAIIISIRAFLGLP